MIIECCNPGCEHDFTIMWDRNPDAVYVCPECGTSQALTSDWFGGDSPSDDSIEEFFMAEVTG